MVLVSLFLTHLFMSLFAIRGALHSMISGYKPQEKSISCTSGTVQTRLTTPAIRPTGRWLELRITSCHNHFLHPPRRNHRFCLGGFPSYLQAVLLLIKTNISLILVHLFLSTVFNLRYCFNEYIFNKTRPVAGLQPTKLSQDKKK